MKKKSVKSGNVKEIKEFLTKLGFYVKTGKDQYKFIGEEVKLPIDKNKK